MKKEAAGIAVPSPVWTFDGLGKKYYLNEQVDSAQAQAPDSDQDEDTDDGVEAEQEMESTLESPLPFIPSTDATALSKHEADEAATAEAYFKKRELEEKAWDEFWSTRAAHARQHEARSAATTTTIAHKRFRETQPRPNVPEPQTFEQWSEGVERLSANSHSLPIVTGDDRDRTIVGKKDEQEIQSINKRTRSHEQQLYMPGYVVPKGKWPQLVMKLERDDSALGKNLIHGVGVKQDLERQKRIEMQVERMVRDYGRDGLHADSVFQDNYAPGYGYLPHNASHSTDPTRAPPKTGFGLGQRRHAGLWTGDERMSGYITVSDTEDEEEEKRGWRRQMLAEQKIEKTRNAFVDEEEEEDL